VPNRKKWKASLNMGAVWIFKKEKGDSSCTKKCMKMQDEIRLHKKCIEHRERTEKTRGKIAVFRMAQRLLLNLA